MRLIHVKPSFGAVYACVRFSLFFQKMWDCLCDSAGSRESVFTCMVLKSCCALIRTVVIMSLQAVALMSAREIYSCWLEQFVIHVCSETLPCQQKKKINASTHMIWKSYTHTKTCWGACMLSTCLCCIYVRAHRFGLLASSHTQNHDCTHISMRTVTCTWKGHA
jgi:hypothetical protein